jgi:multicomponent Na+:H+ antiporter subunit G
VSAVIADVLVVAGLAVMTLGVYGIVRFPDVYTQLHASGKAAFLGVSVLLVAAAIEGGPAATSRVVLAVVLLALTTPVAAHAIAQAAHHRREPMRSPGAVDESATTPGASAPPRPPDSLGPR